MYRRPKSQKYRSPKRPGNAAEDCLSYSIVRPNQLLHVCLKRPKRPTKGLAKPILRLPKVYLWVILINFNLKYPSCRWYSFGAIEYWPQTIISERVAFRQTTPP